MKKLFSNKSFFVVLLVVLAIIVPFQSARADVVGSIFSAIGSIGSFVIENTIAVINTIVNSVVILTESTIGMVAAPILGQDNFLIDDGNCRLQNLTGGSLEIYQGRCGGGGGGSLGIDVGGPRCGFAIPLTFYIPSYANGYKEVLQNCYDDWNDRSVCDALPENTQRYRPPNFGEPGWRDTDNENVPQSYYCSISDPQGRFVKINSGGGYGEQCFGATIIYQRGQIAEGSRINLYRFSAPISQFKTASGETNKQALGSWFMGEQGIGGGFRNQIGNGLANGQYFTFGGDSPLLSFNYSEYCSGNACTIIDNYDVPENSYIVYVAKILTDSSVAETVGRFDDEQIIYTLKTGKFLSTNSGVTGPGGYGSLPYLFSSGYGIGDVYSGPFSTDTLECPPPSRTPQISVTPTTLSFTASLNSSASNQGSQNIIIRNIGQANSVLNWSASASAPWIVLSSNSAAVPTGGQAEFGVSVNPSSLTAGTHNGTITISDSAASNSPQTINVSLAISATATPTPTYIISPSASIAQGGQSRQFAGNYDPDGPSGPGVQQNKTSSATWRSSDNSIATINNSGYATCKNKSGSATITSVYSGITATAGLTCFVSSAPTIDLKVNGSDSPTAVNAPANLNISWTTTNSGEIINCSGAGPGWNGEKSVSGGNDSGGNLNNIPAGTQTYVITCETTENDTISDSVTIAVNAASGYSCGDCSDAYKYTWETFVSASPACAAPIAGGSISYSKSCSCASGSGTYNPTWNTECETGPIVIIEVPTSTPRPPVCPYETCPQIPLSLQTPDCAFTATPSNLIPPQASTTISWTCQRANTCYLGVSSLPVGYSTPAGFCSAFSGVMESGKYCKVNNEGFTKSVSLNKTTNFALNCRNDNGNEITTSTAKMADPSVKEINPQ